jgi:hypothetical protein
MNMHTIVRFGLFTNEMLPYKCSNLHTYLPTISFAYCPVHQHFHSTAIHLTSMKILFVFFAELRGKEKQVHSAVQALVTARKKGRKNIHGVGAAGGGVASGSDGD